MVIISQGRLVRSPRKILKIYYQLTNSSLIIIMPVFQAESLAKTEKPNSRQKTPVVHEQFSPTRKFFCKAAQICNKPTLIQENPHYGFFPKHQNCSRCHCIIDSWIAARKGVCRAKDREQQDETKSILDVGNSFGYMISLSP